jgi:hypothetical protein
MEFKVMANRPGTESIRRASHKTADRRWRTAPASTPPHHHEQPVAGAVEYRPDLGRGSLHRCRHGIPERELVEQRRRCKQRLVGHDPGVADP